MSERVLRVYVAESGQWAGRVSHDGVEIGGVAGCESAAEVEEAATDAGLEFDDVEGLDDDQAPPPPGG